MPGYEVGRSRPVPAIQAFVEARDLDAAALCRACACGAVPSPCISLCALDDDKRWRTALQEIRKGFGQAKRVAREGVEAISLQRDLFAAAVGIPGRARCALFGWILPRDTRVAARSHAHGVPRLSV